MAGTYVAYNMADAKERAEELVTAISAATAVSAANLQGLLESAAAGDYAGLVRSVLDNHPGVFATPADDGA